MKNLDYHLHTNWALQRRRAAKSHWYVIYRIDNLTRGESYVGRHTVKAGKKPFELNSYWGSGSVVKRWKKQGDHLIKGVVTYSSKKDLNADEVQTVDFFRGTLGKALKNKEAWEWQKYNADKSQWKWRGS